jgi:hypothetical protein
MASARTATSTRRAPARISGTSTGLAAQDAVSPARWAGVSLVVGAILSAVVLAAVSPAESGGGSAPALVAGTVAASPSARAGPSGPGVPEERPVIEAIETDVVTGEDGLSWTRRRELALNVTVPPTRLRPKHLRLEALVDGRVVRSVDRPRGEMAVDGIRLEDGENAVTVRLVSGSGEGPASDPVVVGLDAVPPPVSIRAPRDNAKLTGDTITVTGESEIGARVTIENQTSGDRKVQTVGPSGLFEKVLRSTNGRNRLVVLAQDAAGNRKRETRVVTVAAIRTVPQVTVKPARVKVSSLPTKIRVRARIVDGTGAPVRGAVVTMTLGVPGGQGTQTFRLPTDRDGVAVWSPEVGKPATAGEKGTLTVVAKLPDGRSQQASLSAPEFY